MKPEKRHDPYGAVHKGIRAAHMRCLVAIGAADIADDTAIQRLVADITDHLAMCNAHLEHENAVLHMALEARHPGASAHAAEDHDDHLESFNALNGMLARLGSAPPDQRDSVVSDLYRRFGRFVADDLSHMEHEEHVLLNDLHSAFDDAELRELEGQIVASISPDHMVLFSEAILSAVPPAEKAAMLGGMQAAMPSAAFEALMQAIDRRRSARGPLAAAA